MIVSNSLQVEQGKNDNGMLSLLHFPDGGWLSTPTTASSSLSSPVFFLRELWKLLAWSGRGRRRALGTVEAGSCEVFGGLRALGRAVIRQHFGKFWIVEEVETYCRLILMREVNKLWGQETLKLTLFSLREKKEN